MSVGKLIVSKRLHTIIRHTFWQSGRDIILASCTVPHSTTPRVTLSAGASVTRAGKICNFPQKSPFISETVRDRLMVTNRNSRVADRSVAVPMFLFVCLLAWCLTALSVHIGYIVQWAYICVGPDETQHKQTKLKKNTHKHALPPGLCGDNLLTSWRCHQRGLSKANHLASTDNLTKITNIQQNTITQKETLLRDDIQ